MTVASEQNKISYLCDGVANSFDFSFKIFDPSHLKVEVLDVSEGSTDPPIELDYLTDFTVSAVNNDYSSGGTVTTNTMYSSDYKLTIIRNVPFIQGTDYETLGNFNPEKHEAAMDHLAMQIQQVNEKASRVVTVPLSDRDVNTELPPAHQRAGMMLACDQDGGIIAVNGVANVPVTSIMATLLDDATMSAGRATLDTPSNAESQAMADAAKTAAEATSAVGDTSLQSTIDTEKLQVRQIIMQLALQQAVNAGMARFNMEDGFTDSYEDETGIDTAASTDEQYDGSGKFYTDLETALIISQTQVGADAVVGDTGGTEYEVAQSFTLNVDIDITSVELCFNANLGAPTGDVTVRIETMSAGEPTGVLAHVNATVSQSVTPSSWNTFNFTECNLVAGEYAIVANTSDQPTGTAYLIQVSTVDGYVDGGYGYRETGVGSWAFGSPDMAFKVNGNIVHNMILISDAVTADAEPNDAYMGIILEEVDSIVINTDLLAEVTIDGVNWDLITLLSIDIGDGNKMLMGTVDVSARTGTSMQYRIKTLNEQECKIHGVCLLWL